MADDAIAIDGLLEAFGYATPAARAKARAVLEAAALTRPGKQAIAARKRAAAQRALAGSLVRVCGPACAALAADGREPVITGGAGCEVCGGSNNRRAAVAAARALVRRKVRRIIVVGGTAANWNEMTALLGGSVEMQFIDGTRSHTQKEAQLNMRRAQLVVIWGSTPLRHAVSNLYTGDRPDGVAVITAPKRGIESLCREIVRWANGG